MWHCHLRFLLLAGLTAKTSEVGSFFIFFLKTCFMSWMHDIAVMKWLLWQLESEFTPAQLASRWDMCDLALIILYLTIQMATLNYISSKNCPAAGRLRKRMRVVSDSEELQHTAMSNMCGGKKTSHYWLTAIAYISFLLLFVYYISFLFSKFRKSLFLIRINSFDRI